MTKRNEIIGILILIGAGIFGIDHFTTPQIVFISLTAIGWAVYFYD